MPDSRTPATFTSVSAQISVRPTAKASTLLVPRLGQNTVA